jgi:hypothetical protein
MRVRFLMLCVLLGPFAARAQMPSPVPTGFDSLFVGMDLRIDTARFSYPEARVVIAGESHLAFHYSEDAPMVELRLWPRRPAHFQGKELVLEGSPDWDIVDSMQWIDDRFFRCRLRFKSLSRVDLSALVFRIRDGERQSRVMLKLFAYTTTWATFYPGEEDLFIGEEKRYEIVTNQLGNLRLSGEWKQGPDFDFRLYTQDGVGYVSVIPHFTGSRDLLIRFETIRPFLRADGTFGYELPEVRRTLHVKESRLRFLRMDQREVIRERDNVEGIEIQIENDRLLRLHKTYRIEDREERGGPLVAELFTVRYLSNDRVLCMLRPYQYHRMQDGYLFVKDGDEALFVTNVAILPELRIREVQILRDGASWEQSRHIFPGERIEIQLEGEGFSQANIHFEGLDIVSRDTMAANDRVARFVVDVPLDLRKNKLAVYNKGKNTGISLELREYQRPRPLDFVMINYGEGSLPVNELVEPIFYSGTIRDVVFHFEDNRIDQGAQLFGQQILEMEIRVSGPRGELIEVQRLDRVTVCPGEQSIRHAFYQGQQCQRQDISLNQLIFRKTHSLDTWSRIEITVRHRSDAYGGQGFSQKMEIMLHRSATFDVEVSFPAGLMIKRVGVDGFPGLGGISLAMLAEFSFYHKNQYRRPKPFKLGGGFLAQNAFNFNPETTDRDLGIVLLGSVYPLRRDRKLSFPLYGGFGYFLNERKFFYLLGPGIRVNF